jgi:hypothetical protein
MCDSLGYSVRQLSLRLTSELSQTIYLMVRVFHANSDDVSSTLSLVAYIDKLGHSLLETIVSVPLNRSWRRETLTRWTTTEIDPKRQAPLPRAPWSMASYFQRYLG